MSGTEDLSPLGHPKGKDVNGTWTRNADLTIGTPVADKTTLKAVAAADRADGDLRIIDADRSLWYFDAGSSASDSTENFVLTPAAGSGRWLRMDKRVIAKIAIDYSIADATVLFTVPAGLRLLLREAFWEITADFGGGSSSAIGLSSSAAPHTTKGDILGGGSGDVAATLAAANGVTQGTIGVSYSAAPKKVMLTAADTIKFDRITSAFTSGTGYVHLVFEQAA
jgi:hypothetical protein